MNQKGLAPIVILVLLIILGGLFTPIPYYQNRPICPLLYALSGQPIPCQKEGWYLSPSLYQRFSGELEKPVSHSITPFPSSSTTSIPNPTQSFFQCSQNSDCIMVNADRCGCNGGGKATAINRRYVQEWNNQFPKGVMCLAVMSNDKSCIGTIPQCINNQCQLIKK